MTTYLEWWTSRLGPHQYDGYLQVVLKLKASGLIEEIEQDYTLITDVDKADMILAEELLVGLKPR